MKQGVALGMMQMGKNVFLTGQAGSGKTYILNRYIDFLRAHEIDPAITASTGIAATHIGGTTIHSWAGVGIKSELSDYDIELMQEKQHLWKRFENVQVLIIDEISMIAPEFLDSVDKVLRAFRFSAEPFGGVQVIISGDFFQLPPVQRMATEARYAWESNVWQKLDLQICYLEEQHRQGKESKLNSVLNEIRDGAVSEDSMNLLRGRYRKNPEHTTEPTKLYTHNVDVDTINQQELDKLSALPRYFDMTTKGNKKLVETLKKGTLAQERIGLKIDAHVLFVKNNYERGYMNGTTGVVIDYSDEGHPIVALNTGTEIVVEPETWSMEEGGKVLASISQVPLRLAWAITIHKSQGMSLDAAEIDLSKAFASGQGYVALSRLRSLSGLKLMGCNQQALSIAPEVLEQDALLQELSEEHQELYLKFSDTEKQNLVKASLTKMGAECDETIVLENTKKLKKKRKKKSVLKSTHEQTKDLIKEKRSVSEIAQAREISEDTVIKHIHVLRTYEPQLDIDYLKPDDEIFDRASGAVRSIEQRNNSGDFLEDGSVRLRSVYALLDEEVSYEDIKLCLLFL